ncbi:MAG: hypothetical protein IK002_03855 [Treponema sp.]|uniref:hypothetical protein n=1 Tax=Treponema sp. TaxID=166 RepID=UPI00298E1C9E|nr:hypothetical protein [Treponema sp.]MBR5933104.1 hypothetical protein [Treponema sp.]
MKTKFLNSIIVTLIILFIGTLAGTGAVIYNDYKNGKTAAKTKFDNLIIRCENTIEYYKEPTEEFLQVFVKEIESNPYSYKSLTVKFFGQDCFVYPAKSNSSKRGIFTTYSNTIIESNTINLNITAEIYDLPLTLVFSRLKITFIAIITLTLISAFILVVLSIISSEPKDKKARKSKEEMEDKIEFADETELNEDTELFEEDSVPETEYTEEAENEEQEIQEEPVENTVSENTLEEASEPAFSKETSSEAEEPENEPAEEKSIDSLNPTDHEEMFSSITGFCFEKHLVTRLESELARAAGNQTDISLVLISIPGLEMDSPCGVDICKKILDIFHYRDMLFEYKSDGIAVIFTNADIDKAMESCESIYTELASILVKHKASLRPIIGIASRSLRFVSGQRIISEAEQALIHAKSDIESPIIAFRVNPEKYRKYMASKE